MGLVSPTRNVGGTWLDTGLVSPRRDVGGTWLDIGLASPRRDVGGTCLDTGLVSPRRDVGGTWLDMGLASLMQRDAGGTWPGMGMPWLSPSRDAGGTHPGAGPGEAGCPHPDLQRQAAGALSRGAAQAGGLQDVAAAPVAQEAPGIQVHLIARRLEVEGHCGDRGTGRQGGGWLQRTGVPQAPGCPRGPWGLTQLAAGVPHLLGVVVGGVHLQPQWVDAAELPGVVPDQRRAWGGTAERGRGTHGCRSGALPGGVLLARGQGQSPPGWAEPEPEAGPWGSDPNPGPRPWTPDP